MTSAGTGTSSTMPSMVSWEDGAKERKDNPLGLDEELVVPG
jgi:hypothetical protein